MPTIQPTIAVDKELCRKDGLCVDVCPARFLTRAEDGFPAVALNRGCIVCGHCVAVCPSEALGHSAVDPGQMLEASRDLPRAAQLDGLLAARRSVRQFRPEPLKREVLDALLEVGRRAPTATNSQRLHWTVVNSPARMRDLAGMIVGALALAQPDSPQMQAWREGYDWVLRGAPALVVASTPADYGWGTADCAIAVSYIELAAAARGLGTCWAGYLMRVAQMFPPMAEALELPTGHRVHAALMLGQKRVNYRRIPPRKPLSAHWLE